MQQRTLGATGLSTSILGFGAGHIGSPDMDEHHAGHLLNLALDLGITLFDTAPGYGLSEERLGRHLSHRRSEYVLVSKCGYGVPGVPDWTPACISAGIDQALGRLWTDYLDVMLFHSCPREVLLQPGLIEALEAALRAGKLRAIGYSGENADLAVAMADHRLGVFETSVNLFDQRGLNELIPDAAGRGAGIIGKRPLGNAPWRFSERPVGNYAEVYWERMQAMGLQTGGLPWDEFALRFAAYQPGVSSVIAGTSNLDNLRRNVQLVQYGPLPDDLVQAAREAFKRHDHAWLGQV